MRSATIAISVQLQPLLVPSTGVLEASHMPLPLLSHDAAYAGLAHLEEPGRLGMLRIRQIAPPALSCATPALIVKGFMAPLTSVNGPAICLIMLPAGVVSMAPAGESLRPLPRSAP